MSAAAVMWGPDVRDLGRAVAALGVFDGVHLGHQALLRDAVALAREAGVSSAAVTFDRDPDRVIDPAHAAPQLLELEDKLAFIAEQGIDLMLVVPFDAAVAAMPPRAFLDEVLASAFGLEGLVVGLDFRFGAKAAGHAGDLAAFGAEHGFAVTARPLLEVEGTPVTSTRIRALVGAGEVAAAARLLGRPHRIVGTVERGRGEGERLLGTATANLAPPPYAAMPADGVYAARARLDGRCHAAAVSVGVPPSFPEARHALEAHLLEFDGDLYGQRITLEFLERLRDQRRFESQADLAATIASDIEAVRYLAG